MTNYNRGTVWWIDLPLDVHSHIQGGARPCLIVSNPLEHSGVVTVCPLSTKIDTIPTHPKVFVKKEGQVLVEQITTVDISSIGDYAGTVSDEDMQKVDKVINNLFLGSNAPKSEVSNDDIEKELKKITQMLEFLLWKDGHYGKNI